MRAFVYQVSTQLKFQLPIVVFVVAGLAAGIWYSKYSGVDLESLDRSTFITSLSAIASITALFCSLSIAWILFVSQQNKSERVAAFDLLKGRLFDVQRWLLEQPETDDREICLSLAFELSKHDMSDLPQTDYGDEYEAYTEALDTGLDSDDADRRIFFLTSATHFTYIEQLLSRIGIISIRQVVSNRFIDTLAKGISLIGLAVLILVVSTLWYGNTSRPFLVLSSSFVGIGAVLLLIEIWADLRRNYNEELDFIGDEPDEEET